MEQCQAHAKFKNCAGARCGGTFVNPAFRGMRQKEGALRVSSASTRSVLVTMRWYLQRKKYLLGLVIVLNSRVFAECERP